MNSPGSLLLALEERLLTTNIRNDADALASLLADDFVEFGSSGRAYTKREIMDELAAEPPRRISLYNFNCQPLSAEAALVTYVSRSEAGEALRSSVWIHRDGCWRMLFHQGTKVASSPGADAVS